MPVRITLGALFSALLCAGGVAAPADRPIAPGQTGYWVRLLGLRASEGSMDPPFSADGTEFTLTVDNNEAASLVLTLELDMAKYDPLELPKISFNDEAFEYSPVDGLRYVIQLDKTPAPIDKVYRIKVVDPAGAVGWPIPQENAHEYAIRVLQAPVYEQVINAVGIMVRGTDGSAIEADTAFDPTQTKYFYHVPGSNPTVKLEVLCTPWATGMAIDGVDVAVNETQTIVMEHALKQVNVQCQYADPKYTAVMQEKTYALKFERSVHLQNFQVALKISAEEGYCAMREIGEGSGVMGFVCRSAVDQPTFVAVYNDQVDVTLVSREDSADQHRLSNGVVLPIGLTGRRSEYVLRVLGSAEPREFPVEVIRAASCSTLTCGAGKLHRKGLLNIEAAQAHLCLAEVCTAEDEDRCCEAHDGEHDHESGHGKQQPQLRNRIRQAMAKKVAFYRTLGCSPTPQATCNGQPCFFDESCLTSPPRNGGLGCWAAGISGACRFCGFGAYEACPKWYDCSGLYHAWAPEHSAWCYENYGVHFPRVLHHVEFWGSSASSGGAAHPRLGSVTPVGIPAVAAFLAASGGLLATAVSLLRAGAAALQSTGGRPSSQGSVQGSIRREVLLQNEEVDYVE